MTPSGSRTSPLETLVIVKLTTLLKAESALARDFANLRAHAGSGAAQAALLTELAYIDEHAGRLERLLEAMAGSERAQ
jgi:hypothetical protein